MGIRRYLDSRRSIALAGLLLIALIATVAVGLWRGGDKGSAPKIAAPETIAPTIAIGPRAAAKVPGKRLSIAVQKTPALESGRWVLVIDVQGGKDRSKTLASAQFKPGEPFLVSNGQPGTYTIAPQVLNCAKDCSAGARGYSLPPLTVPAGRDVTLTVVIKCTRAALSPGIDCARSQVLASFQ